MLRLLVVSASSWLIDSQTRLRTAIAGVGGVPATIPAPPPPADADGAEP